MAGTRNYAIQIQNVMCIQPNVYGGFYVLLIIYHSLYFNIFIRRLNSVIVFNINRYIYMRRIKLIKINEFLYFIHILIIKKESCVILNLKCKSIPNKAKWIFVTLTCWLVSVFTILNLVKAMFKSALTLNSLTFKQKIYVRFNDLICFWKPFPKSFVTYTSTFT